MANITELGKRTKKKYPGQYDDISDDELGRMIKKKYPTEYADYQDNLKQSAINTNRTQALFDAESGEYDYDSAKAAGLTPDETGHWPSRDPKTGLILKGRKHPTWDKTLQGEADAGYKIIKKDGRYYSFPSTQTNSKGLLQKGNIDLASRPETKNPDGTKSTVYSMGFDEDGKYVLVPGVALDGSRKLSPDEAWSQYKKTGKHLGMFKDQQSGDAYAKQLHEDYESGRIKLNSGEKPGIAKRLWDWSGKPLLPVTKLTEAYLNKDYAPIGTPWTVAPPTPQAERAYVNKADPGTMHGIAGTIEGMTSPRSLAMMAALGGIPGMVSRFPGLLNVGFPGTVVATGLGADTAYRGKKRWDEAVKAEEAGENPNVVRAGKTGAAIDALLGVTLPFAAARGAGGARRTAESVAPRSVVKAPPVKPAAPSRPAPQIVEKPTTLADTPYEPGEPWYVARDRARAAERQAQPDNVLPERSSPLPQEDVYLPELKQRVHPKVAQEVGSTVNMRMNEIAELFESGVGGLSGKGKKIEGLDLMSYEAGVNQPTGFGKIRVKGEATTPELRGFNESPGKIAEAIRKDGDNPLYLRVKEAVSEHVVDQYRPDIEARNADVKFGEQRTPEGYFDYERFGAREPGEEGFADISRSQGTKKRYLGERTTGTDLRRGFIDKDGNVFEIGSDLHNKYFGGRTRQLVKSAQEEGLVRVGGATDSFIDINPFGEVTPGQMRAISEIKRTHPNASLTWEAMSPTSKTPTGGTQWGTDWRSFVDRFGSQEGFADILPHQKPALSRALRENYRTPGLDAEFFDAFRAGRPASYALNTAEKDFNFQRKFDDDVVSKFLGEEGFADVPKDQKPLPLAPMAIPGQTKDQASVDLFNQILQAPDAAVSKRDLLGINKDLKKKKSSIPLFQSEDKSLF
jgi:hypothetical protein